VKRLGKVAALRELAALLQSPVALVVERDGEVCIEAKPMHSRGLTIREAIANAATHHRCHTTDPATKAALTKLADRVLGRKP
jgi:hypothetical protein